MACPRAAVPSGPLPPLPDTSAGCTAHCLAPSEAQSLSVSYTWTAGRAPDCVPRRCPRAQLRGKALPVSQPGCPARNSRLPPQHSPAAGFARCPAPSLQRLQPPPSEHPLCPFSSMLPRSTPSMWPPGSCPVDPAGPSGEQTLTPRAAGAFTRGRRAAASSPGKGLGAGAGPPAGLDALGTRVLCGSEPQTAASCPVHPRSHPACLPHPHPPLGGVPGLQGPGGKAGPGAFLPSSAFSLAPSSTLRPAASLRLACPLAVLSGGCRPLAKPQVSPAGPLSPPVFSPEPDPARGQGTSRGTAHEQLGFHPSVEGGQVTRGRSLGPRVPPGGPAVHPPEWLRELEEERGPSERLAGSPDGFPPLRSRQRLSAGLTER